MIRHFSTTCKISRIRLAAISGIYLFCLGVVSAEPVIPPPAPIATNLEAIVAERKSEEKRNPNEIQAQLMEAINNAPDSTATPMRKISLPIANHPNGRVKATLSADYALFPAKENDYLRARNMTIELFSPFGELEGIFLSDNAVFDSATKMGYCDGPVRMLYRRIKTTNENSPKVEVLEITGTNMVMDVSDDNTKITVPVSPVVKFDSFMDGIGKAFRK